MCVGIAQHELHTDLVEEESQKENQSSFLFPTDDINRLNPKSYHINLGKQAVIVPSLNSQKPVLATFGWTVQPKWGGSFYCYNVRVEGSKNKGGNPNNDPNYQGQFGIKNNFMVKEQIKSQRCIIPVDFFVEQPHAKTDKRKFIIRREDQQAFNLAGIYNETADQETGEVQYAFTILTTAYSEITAKANHQRSPLVLENEHLDFYLNPKSTLEQLEALYQPPSSKGFIAYEVDNRIAKRSLPDGFAKDDKRLIEPIGDVMRIN